MQKAVPFVAVALILFLLFIMNAPSKSGVQKVTLQSAPGNEVVQMFEHVGAGDEGKVTTFRSGTICRKLGGPMPVTIEGITMSFYKLDCGENSGYVNARWVDD